MTDRPIIFSASMVRALIEGRKAQTRRILPFQPIEHGTKDWTCLVTKHGPTIYAESAADMAFRAVQAERLVRYAPGDRLWVREAWRTSPAYDDLRPSDLGGDESIRYEMDGQWESWGWGDLGCVEGGRYRHARFMPRWASRLTLTVTDVRVQRVQEIGAEDAISEGVARFDPTNMSEDESGPVWRFAHLWETLHGPDAWERNDWVCALSFTVERRNIDHA